MEKRPFVGECTRYLGSGVTGDFGWMDVYRKMKLQHIGAFRVWVLWCVDAWMSQETLGGCMFTPDETMVRTRYLGSNNAEDFGR